MSRWQRVHTPHTIPILLPSPYAHENQPYAARHHRRGSMPWWGWLLLGATVGCASTVGWMVTGLDSRWHDQWQTVLRRVDDQTAQLDTQRQRLNHQAILLTESLHLLDQHTTAIAFNGRRLDAHADEFVERIAQLEAHATQLTAHQQLLHTQSQMRTQQATQWSRVQPAHAAVHPNGPPTLEIFAPLHTPASVARLRCGRSFACHAILAACHEKEAGHDTPRRACGYGRGLPQRGNHCFVTGDGD